MTSRPASLRSRALDTRRRFAAADIVAMAIGFAFGLSALLVAGGLFIRLALSP